IKSGKYPISRSLFLAAKRTTSPVVKQFIEFALSPQGQQIGQNLGFISVQ
ncbi:phosphate ABC transporter substrate-binding protein, partial [Pseudanabaena sp. UWO311]